MSRVDVVIDLETMGTSYNAAIVALGAVALVDGEVHSEFYARISLGSSLAAGCVVDASTVEWWMTQEPFARKEVDGSLEQRQLGEALNDFFTWFTMLPWEGTLPFAWGNGPSFDCVILRNACAAVGITAPWRYYGERDIRTILDLYPEARGILFQGVKHHALDDARHEARMLALALRKHEALRLLRAQSDAPSSPSTDDVAQEPGRAITFELIEFNTNRLLRGAEAAKVAVIKDGQQSDWLWMSPQDIRNNIAEFGPSEPLEKALAQYRAHGACNPEDAQ